jgi:hypothetical protein
MSPGSWWWCHVYPAGFSRRPAAALTHARSVDRLPASSMWVASAAFERRTLQLGASKNRFHTLRELHAYIFTMAHTRYRLQRGRATHGRSRHVARPADIRAGFGFGLGVVSVSAAGSGSGSGSVSASSQSRPRVRVRVRVRVRPRRAEAAATRGTWRRSHDEDATQGHRRVGARTPAQACDASKRSSASANGCYRCTRSTRCSRNMSVRSASSSISTGRYSATSRMTERSSSAGPGRANVRGGVDGGA